MKYRQPFDQPSAPNASYQNANPALGSKGSILDIIAVENLQREVVQIIADFGLTPSDGDLTQLWQALRSILATDTGTADAVICTLTPALPATPRIGTRIFVKKMNADNTGALNITHNGTTYPILDATGAGLAAGAAPANYLMELVFTGTAWLFVNRALTATPVSSLTGVSGEGVSVDGTNHINLNFPGLTGDAAPGATDVFAYYKTAAGHHRTITWAQLQSLLPSSTSGAFIKRWQAQTGTYVPLTTQFTPEKTPMAITDGVQLMTLAVTPRDVNSVFDLSFIGAFQTVDAFNSFYVYLGIFRQDGTCVATGEWFSGVFGAMLTVQGRDVPSSASALTYSVRCGIDTGSPPIGFNGRPPTAAGYTLQVSGLVSSFIANEIRA